MLDRLTIERARNASEQAPIVVALSGGGDSTALLYLLVEEIGAAQVRAVVVDHALRDGSADDAQRALGFAQTLGVAGEIVTLSWPDGPKRAQAPARAARYAALCAAARRCGARVITTGHSRDDQAETVFLRAARGSGWRGLAGMRAFAPAPAWPEGRGLWLARPLLGARRDALRDMLRARAADWIEDPSNSNADFARVRARSQLARLAQDGLDPMRLAALAERLAPRAAALDQAAAELIEGAVRFDADAAIITRSAWCGADAVRQRALGALITAAAGAAREPEAEQVVALEGQLRDAGFKAATLGGAEARRRGETIVLRRDPGALAGRADGAAAPAPTLLPAGAEIVWDRRVALTMQERGWSVVVADGVPHLANDGAHADFIVAAPRWLLEARVKHALGVD